MLASSPTRKKGRPAHGETATGYPLGIKKEPSLPRTARIFLASAPNRGNGLHRWIFRAALVLRKAGVAEVDIKPLIETACAGEPLQPNEIADAVRNSRQVPAGGTRVPKWPAVSLADRARVILEHGGLVELEASSPGDATRCTPRRMFKRLFRTNELVCAGTSPSHFLTRARGAWLDAGLVHECHVVPSPMKSWHGQTRDGRMSARSLNNVGARRWLVGEQDHGTLDEQAAIVLHLAQFAPLGMVVFSGSKSLHAWFATAEQPETVVLRFFKHAVSLGVDPAMWNAAQMARLPGALRHETGIRQRAVYVDFDVIKQAKWGNAS